MIEQHKKECLSEAYVRAVAARVGIDVAVTSRDYGVDGTFRETALYNGRHYTTGFPLDFQLKASVKWEIDGDSVVYDVEAKTYNDLVRRSTEGECSSPFILILLCLLEDSEKWLIVTEDELLLKKCCYWTSIKGSATENDSTVRIRIPCSNLLTPQALSELFVRIRAGESI